MRVLFTGLLIMLSWFFLGCQSKSREKERFQYEKQGVTKEINQSKEMALKPSETVDLSTKGIGPVSKVNIASEIDIDMAKKGEAHFKRALAKESFSAISCGLMIMFMIHSGVRRPVIPFMAGPNIL